MLRLFAAFLLCYAVGASSGQSAELGTRDEAIAIVKRVQKKFDKDGADATFKAITEDAANLSNRDLYAFVYDMKGVNVAHGDNHKLVGMNRINLKDADGHLLIQEFLAVAKHSGSGWVDYCWSNPVSIEDKSSYVERLGENYVVGVAVFRQ